MIAAADTNALIWYIFESSRLSQTARAKFEQAALQGEVIGFHPLALQKLSIWQRAVGYRKIRCLIFWKLRTSQIRFWQKSLLTGRSPNL